MDRVTVGPAGPGRQLLPRAPGVLPRFNRTSWPPARRQPPAPCPPTDSLHKPHPTTTAPNRPESCWSEVPHPKIRDRKTRDRRTRGHRPEQPRPPTPGPASSTPGIWKPKDLQDGIRSTAGAAAAGTAGGWPQPLIGTAAASGRPRLERPQAAAFKQPGPRRRCRGPGRGGVLNAGEPRTMAGSGLST